MKRVGILGGSFSPIHHGHIDISKFLLDISIVDEIWITPCYNHTLGKKMVSYVHRLEMCKIICSKLNNDLPIKVFDYEIKNKLSGKTIDLFKCLYKEYSNIDFNMIIGLDNAIHYEEWDSFNELKNQTRFIVVSRKGIEKNPKITWFLKSPHIYVENKNGIDISSTEIRRTLSKKYLDNDVFEYIKKHKLYK